MKYVMDYDIAFDYVFQVEIKDELAERTKKTLCQDGQAVSDTPFPGIPIDSRFMTVRHPGCWDDQ